MSRTLFAFKQWAIWAVYSNRICQNLYKACSALVVQFRKVARLFFNPRAEPGAGVGLAACDSELRPFQRYQQQFLKLPGWFSAESHAVFDSFLTFQRNRDVRGSLLEIGVFKGKSATCLALHALEEETCVFVDQIVLPEFKDTIRSIRKSNNLFVQNRSSEIPNLSQVMELGATFRWIHIDGEHSGVAVRRDLQLAQSLLARQGIICVDDFPSCAYPQVNFAVTEFLLRQPSLTMIACGHNKGYICHRESARPYLEFIRDDLHRQMELRGANVTIWRSGRPADPVCFGITDRVDRFDYRGPDWCPRQIRI